VEITQLHVGAQGRRHDGVDAENDEVSLVVVTHAGAGEETVVVSLEDAVAAVLAVVRARWGVQLAGDAVPPACTTVKKIICQSSS
jgi:hypothetical protein